jgi:hypothetical protein
MNLQKLSTVTIAFILFLGINISAFAQIKGDKNVVKQNRAVPSFNRIQVGGTVDLFIAISPETSLKVETDSNLQDKIQTSVSNNTLVIKTKDLKNPTVQNVFVTLPELTWLKASGATNVKGESLIETDELKIEVSGATSVSLDVDVQYLETSVSGAADLKLSGRSGTHMTKVSGAADLDATSMVSEKVNYDVSGAADATLNATGEVSGNKSGSADVIIGGSPAVSYKSPEDSYTYSYRKNNYYDSTKVKVGGLEVEVWEGPDSVKIRVGNRELHVDENGNVRFCRSKIKKFNGHWAGFEMGLNGYVNPDYKMSFPKETEYMDLRTTKSWAVHVNFFEQNISLSKNQKWGMVTGLGTYWNNYRFSKATRLNSDSSELIGYIDRGISIRKSKLTVWYVDIPLLFEFQTNRYHNKNSFHINMGMIAGLRISSHTKKYYNEFNKEFDVTRYDPNIDDYKVEHTATSPNNAKTKTFDDFYMNPFKFDATVRIGWGKINLFATYAVNTMFKKDKGPELYPWTAGITFVNF